MKVGTQQDDHQSSTGTKALTDQGYPIDDTSNPRQRSESTISLAASQSNIVDGSDIDFVYHNPPPSIVKFEHVNAD